MTATDQTPTPYPTDVAPAPAAPVRWFAAETTAADGTSAVELCQSAEDLATLIVDQADTVARLVVSAVEPAELARLRIADTFGVGGPPPLPAPPGPPPSDPSTPSLPTVEEAATWSVEQWVTWLDREKVTKTRALKDLSRAAGRTIGLEDVHGHPDLAAVLLAFAHPQHPGEGS